MTTLPGAQPASTATSLTIPKQIHDQTIKRLKNLQDADESLISKKRSTRRPTRGLEAVNASIEDKEVDNIIQSESNEVTQGLENVEKDIKTLATKSSDVVKALESMAQDSCGHNLMIGEVLDMMRDYPELAMNMEAELMKVGKQSRKQRAQDLSDMVERLEDFHTALYQTREILSRLDLRCATDSDTIRSQTSKISKLEEQNESLALNKQSLQAEHDKLVEQINALNIRIKVYETLPHTENKGTHLDMQKLLEAIEAIPKPVQREATPQPDSGKVLQQYKEEQVRGRMVEGMDDDFYVELITLKSMITKDVPSDDEENFPTNWVQVYNIFQLGAMHQREEWGPRISEVEEREKKVAELEARLKSTGEKYKKIKNIAAQIESERQDKDKDINRLKGQLTDVAGKWNELADYAADLDKRFKQLESEKSDLEKENTAMRERLDAFEANAAQAPEIADLQQQLTAKSKELRIANQQSKTWYDYYEDQKKKTTAAEQEIKDLIKRHGEEHANAREAIAKEQGHLAHIKLLERNVEQANESMENALKQNLKDFNHNLAERREISIKHQEALQKQINKTDEALGEVRTKTTDWKVKRDTERRLKDAAERRADNAEKQVNDLNQQLTTCREALTKSMRDVGAEKTALTESEQALNEALEEVQIVRNNLSLEKLKSDSLSRGVERAEFVSSGMLDLKNEEIERLKSNSEKLRRELTSKTKKLERDLASANATIDQWREGILRHVFSIENWSEVNVDERALAELMAQPWPQYQSIQQAATHIAEGHNTGQSIVTTTSASLAALRIWILASIEFPTLTINDIMQFAAALTGVRYNPRVLAFLEAALAKMMAKRTWSTDQAFFCLYAFELLVRANMMAHSRLLALFSARIRITIPSDIVLRGLERLIESHFGGRFQRGGIDTRGIALVKTIANNGFQLQEGVFIAPYNDQLIVATRISHTESIFIRPLSALQVLSNPDTGSYEVSVEGVPVEQNPWKYEGRLEDGYGDLLHYFPDVEIEFEEAN